MLENNALELLVHRLGTLNEKVDEEATAVFNILSIFENLVEIKPEVGAPTSVQITFLASRVFPASQNWKRFAPGEPLLQMKACCTRLLHSMRPKACMRQVAEELLTKGKLLKWMLGRLRPREFDSNKQYCAEVLAILLQGSTINQKHLVDAHGLDTLLYVRCLEWCWE